jgi:peptidoglycan/LPS O-acetylase OafA/YrhL
MNAVAAVSGASPQIRAREEDKILGVELLRFASACAVLIFHYKHFAYIGGSAAHFHPSAQPFYPLLGFLYTQGFYGVEVFWCISGFIFYWKYASAISQRKVGGYSFFALRFSRLYPLHLTTLGLVALLQLAYFRATGLQFVYQHNDLHRFVLQLFMASNWLTPVESFDGPIWSISLEVLVYALFFLTVRYVSKSPFAAAAIALLAALVQVLKISTNPLFPCVMFFYLGCLCANVYERTKRERALGNLASIVAALLLVGAVAIEAILHLHAKYFLVVCEPCLVFLAVRHMPSSDSVTRLLVPAGNMTYSSYLLHFPIQLATVTVFAYFGRPVPVDSPALFLGFMAVTLFLSYWTYRLLEMPAQKLIRNRLLHTRVQKPLAAPRPS